MRIAFALAFTAMAVTACERQPAARQQGVQRVSLDDAGKRQAGAEPSPDTSQAVWQVSEDGQAIRYGDRGADPLLTLACDVDEEPPQLVIIRHARAYPGQGALFPVIGNGINSRFLVDAALADGEWHWEARLPADDPQLEVFSGTRDITATLPGRGTLEIEGTRITGEFLEWCQAGGRPEPVESDLPEEDAT
ncbi:hypothetical protein [Aurantiacibacter poecillastricola]|uniref:hypothetical protein n=1 Tax=Aurantiacibacter poecillastricola TaxID=3064385 RepID=UPI00273DB39F|nr:hypothetical protein [Aurantiacibacter sp. 219JJ12-13]MDP5261439.1 hypothetical protein [Aurantiacibacter sp. 219JJ12-13]